MWIHTCMTMSMIIWGQLYWASSSTLLRQGLPCFGCTAYSKRAKQELRINSPIFTSYITFGVQELQMYATNSPRFTWLLGTELRVVRIAWLTLLFCESSLQQMCFSYVPQMLVQVFLDGYRQATQHAEYLCRLWLWISSVHSSALHSSMRIPTGLEWSTPFLAQKSLPGLEVGSRKAIWPTFHIWEYLVCK